MAHTPEPCECWVDDGEDYKEPSIVYCPLHAQALAMRNALTEAIEQIEGFYGRDIQEAYRRGDATKEERDTVLRGRAILRVLAPVSQGGTPGHPETRPAGNAAGLVPSPDVREES